MKFLTKQYTATNDRSFKKKSGLIIGSAEDISLLFYTDKIAPEIKKRCTLDKDQKITFSCI